MSTGPKSITISVTIPMQLNEFLLGESKKKGVSRSRLISNVLLEKQEYILGKVTVVPGPIPPVNQEEIISE